MLIGLDFDNTIVCYDEAIKSLAEEKLNLPAGLKRNKLEIRNFLRSEGRESEWTSFQGELYGPGIREAKPYKGTIRTMQNLVKCGHDLAIISHRTKTPYAGVMHDLHKAARSWIRDNLQSEGIFTSNGTLIEFHETLQEKVHRIKDLECGIFVDDLPEVLTSPGFPDKTTRILFDPNKIHDRSWLYTAVSSWETLEQMYCR